MGSRRPRAVALAAVSGLLLLVTGCGEPRASGSTTAGAPSHASAAEPGSVPSALPEGATARVRLPPLPSLQPAPEPSRPEPVIGDLEAAERAFGAGFYAATERALPALTRQPGRGRGALARVALLRARLLMETGRYEEAEGAALEAAREPTLRLEASTLHAEALLARGRLEEAEAALRGLAGEGPAHRARLLLGRLLLRRGRGVEAEPVLMALIDAFNDQTIRPDDGLGLSYVAMAALGLGSPQDANDAFRDATREAPDHHEIQLEWARLFLSKYDAGNAEESVAHVLERNPEHPLALALLARIRLDQRLDFVAAEDLIARALRVNPNLVMAHVTLAGIALRDLDLRGADAHLDRALAVDPNDLEALSVRAAVRFLAEDSSGFERALGEVHRRNRTYSQAYTIIAEFADWEHRYAEIVQLARRAVTLDPGDALAHATLGLNLLRMGEEVEGLQELRSAWRRDRFNVRVYNTLNLFDDVIGREYESVSADPFLFRMHREERAVLERYVPRTLQRAYRGMVRRYGYTPPAPLRFELYANNEHFSVRTAGLPNVGVQGVCFGRLVTAISPRGGPFSWGQITWHELAHVFHLGISRNRVPRWFTEGLAEYEAGLGSDHWRREMDHILLRFLESDRLPALSQMNRAFTRARSGEDVMAAYYASSRIVQHIAEVHGFEKLVRMLELWGEGRSSAEVIQQALGLSLDALDTEFREASRRRLSGRAADFGVDFSRYYELEPFRAAAAAHLSDAARQADLAAALLAHGEAEQAATQATRALELDPEHPIARFVLARIALGSEDHAGARIHLDKLVANGADGYEVRLMRARLAMAASDSAAARAELEAAARIDPDRPEAHLGRLELAGPDPAARLPIVERLAEIDEHSRELNAELLGLLEGLGRWEELVRHGERALYIDPHRSETHRALAEAYLHVDRAADALYEADSALLASPEAAAPLHLLRARALQALGRGRAAREAAQQALQADPSLAEAARALGAR